MFFTPLDEIFGLGEFPPEINNFVLFWDANYNIEGWADLRTEELDTNRTPLHPNFDDLAKIKEYLEKVIYS